MSATFRDYDTDSLDGTTFSVRTEPGLCRVRAQQGTGPSLDTELDAALAREIGTFILHCAGNESLHAEHAWVGLKGTFGMYVEDGNVTVTLTDATELPSAYGQYVDRALSYEESVDLGQRLIIWAGVAE
jgi:hypothetical protein